MTCTLGIRGAAIQGGEPWSRWSNMNHRTLLVSERESRMPGRGIRLLPIVRYGVIALALCLLLSDSFRLLFSKTPATGFDRTVQSGAPGTNHARAGHLKRHPGV